MVLGRYQSKLLTIPKGAITYQIKTDNFYSPFDSIEWLGFLKKSQLTKPGIFYSMSEKFSRENGLSVNLPNEIVSMQ